METKGQKPPHLVLIPGGQAKLGPISQKALELGPDSSPTWAVVVYWTTKAVLLASMVYFVFG